MIIAYREVRAATLRAEVDAAEVSASRARAAVARGEADADVLFVDARVVNTLTGEIERTNVAVVGGFIAGLGGYRRSRQTVDLRGRYLVPGLIDGHVHVESSMLVFPQYARAVVPHGTLGIATDLHEIANVLGPAGFRAMARQASDLPLDVLLLAPSCVPSSPFDGAAASVSTDDIAALFDDGVTGGLGEVMDAAGVVAGDESLHAKLAAARGRIDGHAPGLAGFALNAYLGAGPSSDHECTTLEEARERLRRGAYLMIREGSSERNLEALLPVVDDRVLHRCMLVVDDRSPADLVRDGDLDAVIRKAISLGCEPQAAITMATLSPALYFGLRGHGAIAPGYHANLLVVHDLHDFRAAEVYHRGRLVARDGECLFSAPNVPEDDGPVNTVRVAPILGSQLSPRVTAVGPSPMIEAIEGQIVTRLSWDRPRTVDDRLQSDVGRDLLKLVVVERHRASGRVGVGLVRGFGLRRGALASSLAHDAHNLIAVGVDDADILRALEEVASMRGGLACVGGAAVLARLPLPIAGLLSSEPVESVAAKAVALDAAAASLGCSMPAPFSVLSFLALPSIPEARLTDRGLVDVVGGRLISDPFGT